MSPSAVGLEKLTDVEINGPDIGVLANTGSRLDQYILIAR